MELFIFRFDPDTLKKFSRHTIVAGVIMSLVGLTGIIAPQIMSLVVVSFMAWLFLFAALVQGYATYKSYRGSFTAWLKPAMMLIASLLLLFFPLEGVAAVGMLLAAYLLVDAYANFSFGWEYRPNKGWWMPMINGVLSLLLALILLLGWPLSSIVLVGLFVGISLFFDGIVLVVLGMQAKKAVGDGSDKDEKGEER